MKKAAWFRGSGEQNDGLFRKLQEKLPSYEFRRSEKLWLCDTIAELHIDGCTIVNTEWNDAIDRFIAHQTSMVAIA